MKKNKDHDRINYGLLPDLIGYHVRLTQIAIFRDFVRSLSEYDMTPTQFGTLVLIEANPDVKQSTLAGAIQLDRSSVVSLIDSLEKQGYVSRTRVENDRRANALNISKEGRKLLEKLKPLVKGHEKKMLANLTKTEQRQLVGLLTKICTE